MSILQNAVCNKGKKLLLCAILFVIIATTVVSCITRRTEPQPMNAIEAMLKAFEQNQLVALGDVHGLDQERAFIISRLIIKEDLLI